MDREDRTWQVRERNVSFGGRSRGTPERLKGVEDGGWRNGERHGRLASCDRLLFRRPLSASGLACSAGKSPSPAHPSPHPTRLFSLAQARHRETSAAETRLTRLRGTAGQARPMFRCLSRESTRRGRLIWSGDFAFHAIAGRDGRYTVWSRLIAVPGLD